MDARAGKPTWKLLIVLAVVCGALVFAAGLLHRRAVVDAVAKQQDRSAAVAKALSSDLDGVNVSKPAKGHDEKQLEKSVDPPTGTEIVIFSLDGQQVYATAGARGVGADRGAIAGASKGTVSQVIDGKDMIVYAPIPSEKKDQLAVAAVVSDYAKVTECTSGPLDLVRMPMLALAIVFLVAGLFLMLRERRAAAPPTATTSAKPSRFARSKKEKTPKQPKQASTKSAVSGFEPVPVTDGAPAVEAEEPQEVAVPVAVGTASPKRFSLGARKQKDENVAEQRTTSKKRALFGKKHDEEPTETPSVEAAPAPHYDEAALQREMMMRQALEDQLEQLRTRMQTQEEQANATIRDLHERIAAGGDTPAQSVGPVEQDMLERVRTMETELAQARRAAAEATAQVSSLQQELQTAATAEVSSGVAESESQIRALQQQLDDAQRGAAESEQRAQSIESVRSELEVRVAQLGSKATELEHKAEEMETRLREANEGGDAVRAEIASLTAALAAAEARGGEFEAAGTKQAELEAEISRLRGELGRHMERAQAAEERVASLEADVLAAERGVQELPEATGGTPEHVVVPDDRGRVEDTVEPSSVVSAPEPAQIGSAVESDAVPSYIERSIGREPSVEIESAVDPTSEDGSVASEVEYGSVEAERASSDTDPRLDAEAAPRWSWESGEHEEPENHVEPEAESDDEPVSAILESSERPIESVTDRELATGTEPEAETTQSWRQEWRPDPEPSSNGTETSIGSNGAASANPKDDVETGTGEPSKAEEEPPAPSGDDRYYDVWANAFTEPSSQPTTEDPHTNGSVEVPGSEEEPDEAPTSEHVQEH